jgi:ESCRT-I complex subunit VPS37
VCVSFGITVKLLLLLSCICWQVKDFEAEKEVLLASNRSLAEFNLTKEPQLAEGKRHLQELSETGAVLCQRIESKVSELSKYAACTKLPRE